MIALLHSHKHDDGEWKAWTKYDCKLSSVIFCVFFYHDFVCMRPRLHAVINASNDILFVFFFFPYFVSSFDAIVFCSSFNTNTNISANFISVQIHLLSRHLSFRLNIRTQISFCPSRKEMMQFKEENNLSRKRKTRMNGLCGWCCAFHSFSPIPCDTLRLS